MKLSVMNAYIGTTDFLQKPGYIFEPKLDGFRALCYVNKSLNFMSRNDKNLTSKYPEFRFRTNINAQNAILDGEIIAYNEFGNPSFDALKRGVQADYIVFDILMKDNELLIDKPLMERKKNS